MAADSIGFETFLGTVTSMNVAMAWQHNNPMACVSLSPPLVAVIPTSSETIAVLLARMCACHMSVAVDFTLFVGFGGINGFWMPFLTFEGQILNGSNLIQRN
jgi:hypothetical protein